MRLLTSLALLSSPIEKTINKYPALTTYEKVIGLHESTPAYFNILGEQINDSGRVYVNFLEIQPVFLVPIINEFVGDEVEPAILNNIESIIQTAKDLDLFQYVAKANLSYPAMSDIEYIRNRLRSRILNMINNDSSIENESNSIMQEEKALMNYYRTLLYSKAYFRHYKDESGRRYMIYGMASKNTVTDVKVSLIIDQISNVLNKYYYNVMDNLTTDNLTRNNLTIDNCDLIDFVISLFALRCAIDNKASGESWDYGINDCHSSNYS